MFKRSVLLLNLSLAACLPAVEAPPVIDPLDVDDDGDGYSENEGDCNDASEDIGPSATEVCDETDNDCDGAVDDADDNLDTSTGTEFYSDGDADGYGDGSAGVWACEQPDGAVDNMGDCDDSTAAIQPDATEVCDGIDNDCDGAIDDADESVDLSTGTTYYEDWDADGNGAVESPLEACVQPEGFVENTDDCDDTNAALNRNDVDQDELTSCDGDCNDLSNTVGITDEDGDGSSACFVDCNDNDASLNAIDVDADGITSCDGDCDDGDAGLGITDEDGDGFSACNVDCDDSNEFAYPGAAELESLSACMADADEDGYGDSNVLNCWTVEMFDSWGDSWNSGAHLLFDAGVESEVMVLTSSDDCLDPAVCDVTGGSSGAPEGYRAFEFCATSNPVEVTYIAGSGYNVENSVRITDADGAVYEYGDRFGSELTAVDLGLGIIELSLVIRGTDCDDSDASLLSVDADGDGYDACDTENPFDCDDSDSGINPGIDADGDGFNVCLDCDDLEATVNPAEAETYYDGLDQDCDGLSDYDSDMDGYEAASYEDSNGVVIMHNGPDCDDTDAAVTPLPNEDSSLATCYYDGDGDGYGESDPDQPALDLGVVPGTDCYDSSSTTYPGAAFNEPDLTLCMQDYDGDGYGSDSPSSWYNAVAGTDCYDNSVTTFPGAAELESVSACMQDDDDDGYGEDSPSTWYDIEAGIDCDDDEAALSPGIDGDADGLSSCDDCDDADVSVGAASISGYEDSDGDGYGHGSPVLVCSLDVDVDGVDDYVLIGGDCYDYSDFTFPGAGFNELDPTACMKDFDGDGYGDLEPPSWGNTVAGTDCDDGDSFTFPGAGFNELSPTDEACLTDADGDGYAAPVFGLFEAAISGESLTVTVTDSYGDGCDGAVNFYVGGTFFASYVGPATTTVAHTTAVITGDLWVGWTEAGSYNGECSFTIADGGGVQLYASSGTIDGIEYGPTGTDADDTDATVN